jgi:hypothetical protein
VRAYTPQYFVIRFHNLDEKTADVIMDPTWLKDYHWNERSLTTNQDKKEMLERRKAWNGMEYSREPKLDYKEGKITLRPLEIRTFVVWH